MSRRLVCVGGSDAGISAALRAREVDPDSDVTVVVADAYPNFSICGIPYLVSGEVGHWSRLAHRTVADIEASGITVLADTRATGIDVAGSRVHVRRPDGGDGEIAYDALVIGTGATPAVPPIEGLLGDDALGPADGVFVLHTMADARAVDAAVRGLPGGAAAGRAVVVGAGYIGLEMAEAFAVRGLEVTQIERLPQVLPTVDPPLAALVRDELTAHGVEVLTGTTVHRLRRAPGGGLVVEATAADGDPVSRTADIVLIVVGVRPDTTLAQSAGATTGAGGAIRVDERMRTGVPDVFAAGDCVVTHHRLLGETWLPLGTTAHKQGRVAGENAMGGDRRYAGSLGTQVLKVFDIVAARTGLRDQDVARLPDPLWSPRTTQVTVDDHKAYYPGATPIHARITSDENSGRLLGAQLVGRRGAEIAKRVDVFATALFHGMTADSMSDLDLAYSPPLAAPWDAVQTMAQAAAAPGLTP